MSGSDNLSGDQFAQYSSIEVPDKVHQYRYEPLPASMERHAPGEYQPTLPGMEKMLKGEQTRTDVVFSRGPDEDTKYTIGNITGYDAPKASNWYDLHTQFYPAEVSARSKSLRPTQEWLDDNYLHSDIDPVTRAESGTKPKVESIRGRNYVLDGHHRAAREILSGKKTVDIERWGREADYK